MNFEFATATRIVFGPGKLDEIGTLVAGFGSRALIVTGRDSARAEPLRAALAKVPGVEASATCSVAGEPTLDAVQQAASDAQRAGCDFVIAIGGGSAIDAGKAIAAMLTNEGDLLDYVEVIGRGRALAAAPAPFVAIPTTAGTGSEVTRNAVLASPAHRLKVSLRSPLMLPRVALVDPELTLALPPSVTACTGLDALSQLIEPYTCCRTNPLVDALCAEGIRRSARSLRKAFGEGADATARADLCVASLFGGLALANAGLGAVHGFAAPIGGMFDAPHGAVCAALLAHVIDANVRALRARPAPREALGRYDEIARLLTGSPAAEAEDGMRWIRELVRDLRIPTLRAYGLEERHVAELVEKASRASSMKANPIVLTPDELADIVRAAL